MLTTVLALSAAGAALALNPEADRKALEGLEAGYRLDFQASSAAFSAADRLDPAHPVGPFFLASLKWLEFSMNADVPGTARALEPEFERLIGQVFDRAEAMREKDPRGGEAHFYLGAAWGMRGRWKLLKRQWVRAASDGWKGYKHLRKAVALDPGLYDAYLGLGMYDYYSDKLPAVLRFAARLIVRGDKERGLRYVRIAVEKGHYSVVEAQLFLAGVYMAYEGEPRRALEIIADLRLERPDNLFLLYTETAALIHARDWPAAVSSAQALAVRGRAAAFARPHASLFDLYLADAYLGGRDYARARETADLCVEEAPDPRRAIVTYCALRRAQAGDLLGNREQALRDYAFVEAREDFWDSRDKARRGLKSPATYERVLAELME